MNTHPASILLTGGTGFFGKSILSMLKRGRLPDIKLTILARNIQHFQLGFPEFAAFDDKVDFISGDIRDFEFPGTHFDYILHAATPAKELPPGEAEDIIIHGTERILKFARTSQAKRLLFISSGAVYGNQNTAPVPETFPCNPVSEYGKAKLDAEKMCMDSGIDTVIARGFAFTGYYLNREIHFAIGNFIADCLAGRDIVIKGDGSPIRSYLYADDMVNWLFAMLFHAQNGAIYNVGSDRAVSILDLAETVRQTLKANSKIKIQGKSDFYVKPAPYVPDISKIRRELGVNISIPLENAIRLSAGMIQE